MLFENRYIKYRDSKISEFYHYKLTEDKVEYNNLHYCLYNRSPISGESIGKNEISLEYDKSTVLKAIIGDVELYRAKALLQRENIYKSNGALSACWDYVTTYYFSFYSATLLTRINQTGFIFLNSEKSRYLSDLVTELSSELVSVTAGNYSFKLNEVSVNVLRITLKKSNKKPHDSLWQTTSEILNEIRNLDSAENYEKLIYDFLSNFQFKTNLHSELRNLINYRPLYVLKSLQQDIYNINLIDKADDQLLKLILSLRFKSDDELMKQKISIVTGEFIFRLCESLYQDYKERSFSPGLNKKIASNLTFV